MNYNKLSDDIASGKLDAKKYYIQVENDFSCLCYAGDDLSEDEYEEENDRVEAIYGTGGGDYDIEDIIYSGIRYERC